jgi:hypothetical protein
MLAAIIIIVIIILLFHETTQLLSGKARATMLNSFLLLVLSSMAIRWFPRSLEIREEPYERIWAEDL